ncbi:tyrosine-type recombinase/integrase [Chitinilyticum litopenaei]|uniref:tyrosine-type recombinase/integrase n=1 Tax=Chitinilyticum litopenaei TaxID=1121276 RepID=UPI0009DC4671|nr:tyrosine-type recombinase/integrase [Chitinilyticum litopenaei]
MHDFNMINERVVQARALVKKHEKTSWKSLSESSKKSYQATVNLCRDKYKGEMILLLQDQDCNRSYYRHLAAAKYYAIMKMKALLNTLDNQRKAVGKECIEDLIRKIEYMMTLIEIIHQKNLYLQIKSIPIKSESRIKRGGARSKRDSMIGQPDDWQMQMLAAAEGELKLMIALQIATGCRPSELKAGIMIEPQIAKSVKLTIKGAKITAKSGQEAREIIISSSHPLYDFLANSAGEAILRSTPKAYGNKFTRLALRLNIRGVSPYTLRHCFASDLKKQRVDKESIARALGHASERSQSRYGRASNGKSAQGIHIGQAARCIKSRSQACLSKQTQKTNNPDGKFK